MLLLYQLSYISSFVNICTTNPNIARVTANPIFVQANPSPGLFVQACTMGSTSAGQPLARTYTPATYSLVSFAPPYPLPFSLYTSLGYTSQPRLSVYVYCSKLIR